MMQETCARLWRRLGEFEPGTILDELAVLHHALTPAQIFKLYETQR